MREQRAVGRPTERGRVHHEDGRHRVDLDAGILGAAGSEQLFVLAPVVLEPARVRLHLFARGLGRVADLFFLPHDHLRVAVVDHEPELGGALAPVRGAKDRAEPRACEQKLEHAVAVLADPQHTFALRDALLRERVREFVDARFQLRVGEAVRLADDGGALRVAQRVPMQDVR